MRDELAALGIKAVATAVAAATAFGLTWWAITASFVGAVASLQFEPEETPSKLPKLIFMIFATGIAAALVAVALPSVPMFAWTGNILLEVRAGLLGLTVRFLYGFGKRWAEDRRKAPGG